VRRLREQGRGRPLLDDLAAIHHRDAIGAAGHDAQIVGDQDHRHPELPLEVGQQLQDLRLDRHVERRRGLVGDVAG
jgi:hypothetical protein